MPLSLAGAQTCRPLGAIASSMRGLMRTADAPKPGQQGPLPLPTTCAADRCRGALGTAAGAAVMRTWHSTSSPIAAAMFDTAHLGEYQRQLGAQPPFLADLAVGEANNSLAAPYLRPSVRAMQQIDSHGACAVRNSREPSSYGVLNPVTSVHAQVCSHTRRA